MNSEDRMVTELGKTPEGMRFGLVSYLDLLGSRDLFAQADPRELKSVLEYAGNYQTNAGEHPGMPQQSFDIPRAFVAFQDSLVRCSEIGWTPESQKLPSDKLALLNARWVMTVIDEIASLRDIQLNFLCKRGLLIRGAVCLGVYDITDGRVHGPAYISALDGEESEAKYPRILVQQNVVAMSVAMNPRHDWIQANVRTDSDDRYFFVDYLYGAAREAPWSASWFIEYAFDHKHQIETILRGGKTVPSQKADWLRRYHNMTINRVSNYIDRKGHIDPKDLLVV